MSPVIEVQGLTKHFRLTRRAPGLAGALRGLIHRDHELARAVEDVSFSIQPGETVAFLGPNGAGKSTTLKMLTGILHPTSGSASVLGFTPWKDRVQLVRRLGCVFGQRSQLWYHLPVAETFTLLADVYDLRPADARARLAELSELFELEPLLDLPVRKLSLGQRMRCEVAASLLHRPEVVFLDEPTIGLDVVARARLRELLVRLVQREHVTVVLTSHDAGDVEHVCQRVLLVDGGRLVLDAPLERVRREHLKEKRIEAVIAETDFTLDLPGVHQEPAGKHRVVLRVETGTTPIDRVITALVQGATVHDVTVSDPPLERVLASLYGDRES